MKSTIKRILIVTAPLVIVTSTGMGCMNSTTEPQGELVQPQNGIAKSDKPRETEPDADWTELKELITGNTEFALELYKQLKEEKGNLFFSPYSISVALAMTYAGARGETEEQMRETLRFTLEKKLHQAFNALDLELSSRGEGAEGQDGEEFRLKIVNALWGQDGYAFFSTFLDTLAENYGAGLNLLDFINEAEAAASLSTTG